MKKSSYLLITLVVFLFDQITKSLVRNFIDPSEVIRILPFIHLVSVRNEGAAFGMFRSFGNDTFIVISLAAIALIVFLFFKSREDKLSLSLILAGALGNVTDRILYGSVTDFVDVFVGRFHWPAFNVADSVLTFGIIWMLIRTVVDGRRGSRA